MPRSLFPKIAPFAEQMLAVSKAHSLYIEQSGNSDGIPVLYLHGGPGAGCSSHHRRLFNPEIYHIIMFDQRGCGRSTPSPSIEQNTVSLLVSDISAIRKHLGIEQWLVCGGSWGTTLALLYAIKYPEHVLGFVLRGLFLATANEFNWLYSSKGASKFFPEYYQDFISPLAKLQLNDCHELNSGQSVLASYANILQGDNELAAIAASKSWFLWEQRISTLEHQGLEQLFVEDTHQAHCMALLSAYYFSTEPKFKQDYICENAQQFAQIPAIIIHSRLDMVCPLENAYRLTHHWPNAQLQILPTTGHSGFERMTIDAFVKATDAMSGFIKDQQP